MSDLITPQQDIMAYVEGFKYQLSDKEISFLIPSLSPYAGVKTDWIEIRAGGLLVLKHGFASDGASGPTIDTPSSMRGSFVHDALFELMRKGLIPRSFFLLANEIIREMCIKDDMWRWRANAWKEMLDRFGHKNVMASHRRQVKYAP